MTRVAECGEDEIDRAVAAARKAQNGPWRQTTPADRGRLLHKVAALILENKDSITKMESLDTGKPLAQAEADCVVAARYFEFYAGIADKIGGVTIPLTLDFLDYTEREPLGVVGQIVPWNYPLQMSARGLAPCLAAGNSIVIKPAEEACLSAIELGRICKEAGIPDGVVNVVTGYGSEAGAALASHPDVNLVAFTGSVQTGSTVMQSAAKNVVPVLLELGGKSPNIVFADADLEKATPVIIKCALQNAGQTCSAGSRVLVHRSRHDEVVERLVELAQKYRVGPGIDNSDMGPVISKRQWTRIMDYMDIARDEGAEIATGGKRPEGKDCEGGFFIEPTIFTQASPGMRVHDEEIFGPVTTVVPFDTDEEAAGIANATPYGLVTGLWTQDVTRAHRMAREIAAGQIFVNTYGAGGGVEIPFGGYKKSGFGREKGLEAINFYSQTKNICIGLT
ncbi:aldehyde dehydrogenase family protein (plasmid) [Roseovarius pelagicus]|uniref:Aldehyde dehydrogenase family protein n=1 Tax=Roseovarius pelagicus TaxID=2980108 RepID=A0ABY6D6W0_9RHOB|nr:aldehyde dehydrogenase family protein [Roseovarius pelagicus]